MINLQLEQKVWQACRNAIDNGYEKYILNDDILQVAINMMDGDEDVRELSYGYIVPVVDGIKTFRDWERNHAVH